MPLNSCLIGLDQPYTGRTGGSSRGKGFIIYYGQFLPAFSTWPSGNALPMRGEGPQFDSGASILFFFFLLVFVLVVAVLFCFFIYLTILRFINFLLYCFISSFPRRPSRGPAIYLFLVNN